MLLAQKVNIISSGQQATEKVAWRNRYDKQAILLAYTINILMTATLLVSLIVCTFCNVIA